MKKSFLYIIIGAALWGTIGWYVKHLYNFGFTPMEVVTLRVTSSTILLVLYMIIIKPQYLKLKRVSDIKYFIGTGIISITFFNYCLFTTIELSSLPVATALLYTAPTFVTILSFFFFKEPLTKIKLLALLITLIGTAFVVELLPLSLSGIPIKSIIFGLGSGIGYALYSIFSKFALKKYSSLSVTTFTFIIATVALLPFFPFQTKGHLFMDIKVLGFAIGLGFLPTAIAYIIYTYGLSLTEASNASILTTIEPIVATMVGIFVFKETFSIIQMIGMLLIICAVILIQLFPVSNKRLTS